MPKKKRQRFVLEKVTVSSPSILRVLIVASKDLTRRRIEGMRRDHGDTKISPESASHTKFTSKEAFPG